MEPPSWETMYTNYLRLLSIILQYSATQWSHVHMYIPVTQSENTAVLCQSVVRVAEKNGGYLVTQATQVTTLFTETFGLFALCHNIYNAKLVTEQEIAQLGKLVYMSCLYS